MKYMLLIHQGDTPTPGSDEWERLSEDEQKAVYGAYQALNETPGFSSGVQMQPPETATTVRVQDGKTLTTDGPFVAAKEAIGGYCFFEADDVDAAIELAEEAAQEAFAVAAERWPRDGTPDNPRGWLVTTARNRAIDRIRRDRTLAAKARLLDVPETMEEAVDETTIPDGGSSSSTCCHPALALDAQVALTLRTLSRPGGAPRARPLPLPARHAGGAAAPARSRRRRPRGLRPRA